MSSAPFSQYFFTASVMAAPSSPGKHTSSNTAPYSASFLFSTGVNPSSIRPFFTSLPVTTAAARKRLYGIMLISGLSDTLRAFSMSSFFTARGITLIPHSLSPFFTGISECIDETHILPKAFSLYSASESTLKMPSHTALSSIFPSFGSVCSIFPPSHISRSISAASFS